MEMTYKTDDRSVRGDARQFSNDAADAAQKVREKAEKAGQEVRTLLADGTDQVQRQAKAAMATGDRYVHEQPWQFVGMAALAGLLIGFLIGRR